MPISVVDACVLAQELGVPLGFSNPQVNGFRPIHATTKAAVTHLKALSSAVVTHLDTLQPGNRYLKALQFIQYVNAAGPVQAAAQDRIEQANFVLRDLGLGWPAVTTNGAPSLAPVRAQWLGLLPVQRQAVGAFARSRAANASVQEVLNVAQAPNGTVLQNLQTLAAVVTAVDAARPGDGQRYAAIRAATLNDLRILHAAHAPNTVFAGFAAWGPGDHQNANANIRWHFLKHVLGVTEEDVDVDGTEHADWWRALDIRLTLPQFQQHASGYPDTNHLHRMFTGPNQALSHAWVTEFLSQLKLTGHPRLIGHLVSTYENAYSQYAIARSAHFDEALVQSNGARTFISGRVGDLFIIGRLAHGVLGISSAYFTNDIERKMVGARANKIWNLG